MDHEVMVACPAQWLPVVACHAWGAPSVHGCKLAPGHEGHEHVCPCGSRAGDHQLLDNVEDEQ